MATIRTRKHADGTSVHAAIRRENGNGRQTSETFDDKHNAEMFRDFLNANGQSFTLAEEAFKISRAHGPTMAEMVERHVKNLTESNTARARTTAPTQPPHHPRARAHPRRKTHPRGRQVLGELTRTGRGGTQGHRQLPRPALGDHEHRDRGRRPGRQTMQGCAAAAA
jgi:hypothetical protein